MTAHTDLVELWRDPGADPYERAADLVGRMTLPEKAAQLYSAWMGFDAEGGVAPHQHLMSAEFDWPRRIPLGLGQLTRPFGTAPVDPAVGARSLARSQRELVAAGRFGIPAQVHEECLTGLTAWQATIYPIPLAWAATFDPALVERMATTIGQSMRSLGIHQGLAPLLDVVTDLRWGRVEETLGEDPLLVGTIGSAYVRGLESTGVVATLKHYAGYPGSRAGRNLAPVSVGPRELADTWLVPFEMALRAGARSVMNSYNSIDNVPSAADAWLLTVLLRDGWGFTGTVVSDYYSIAFLQTLHQTAADPSGAAVQALSAGLDVELPDVACYGDPLLSAVAAGAIGEDMLDRSVLRVLTQKAELGLLDPGWDPEPDAAAQQRVDLDPPQARAIARELAERSVVLLDNDGILPLAPGRRIALVGPRADDYSAFLGCYTYPMHVGPRFAEAGTGVEIPTLLEAMTAAGLDVSHAAGCEVLGGTDAQLDDAVALATVSDVCIVAVGDVAGLFGRGTSGEGCDVADLKLPGRQEELVERLLATGTPVVLLLLAGRPYDLSRVAGRLAATVCAFFAGEEGGPAIAAVLDGRVNPSGRLPVSLPGSGTSQPSGYLAPPLALRSGVSNIDPTPLYAFGHGRGYAEAAWGEASIADQNWPTDGTASLSVQLGNPHGRSVCEVVQVYLHDPVAQTVRPVQRLIAAQRVDLAPGAAVQVRFTLSADLTCFTGLDVSRLGVGRIVEPGAVELWVGASSSDIRAKLPLTLTGALREVGPDRRLTPEVTVRPR